MDIIQIAQREGDRAYAEAEGDEAKAAAYLETVTETRKRGRRAEQILEAGLVSLNGQAGTVYVESQSGNGRYTVKLETRECDCPDRQHRGAYCKHLIAAELFADGEAQGIYDLARELVEDNGQWYSGQSRTVWEGNAHKIVITEYGRDGGGLLGLQIRNGSSSEMVQCGILNPERGWIWTLKRSEYREWVAKARRI